MTAEGDGGVQQYYAIILSETLILTSQPPLPEGITGTIDIISIDNYDTKFSLTKRLQDRSFATTTENILMI